MGREKKNDRYLYPAIFTYTEREIIVRFPDLDCEIKKSDEREAYLTARNVLGRTLFDLEFQGKDVPEPTPLSALSLLFRQLYLIKSI